MNFLADMGISGSTVTLLVEEGHNAVHVRDVGMHRASDIAIVDRAKNDGSIVLTCDLDFGDIMAASKGLSPNVIIFRLEIILDVYRNVGRMI